MVQKRLMASSHLLESKWWESLPQPVLIVDSSGKIVAANNVYCKVQGFLSPKNFLGVNLFKILKERHEDELYNIYIKALEGETSSIETESLGLHRFHHRYMVYLLPMPYAKKPVSYVVMFAEDREPFYDIIKELKEAENHYKLLMESASDVICTFTRDGFFETFNHLALENTGLSETELRRKHYLTLVPLEEREKNGYYFSTALSGKPGVFESKFFNPVKKIERNILISYAPIFKDGEIEGVLTIIRDVTTLTSIKKRLDAVESGYRELIEDSGDVIISTLYDGTIVTWNKAAVEILQWQKFEAIGKRIGAELKLLPSEYLSEERIQSILESVHSGDTVSSLEFPAFTKYGEELTLSCTLFPLQDSDGKRIGYNAFIRNVTKIKELEKIADEERIRFRTLVENSTDAIFETDRTGKIVYANPATFKTFAIDEATPLNAFPHWSLIIEDEDFHKIISLGWETLARKPLQNKLFRFKTLDGCHFWGLLSLSPLNRKGRIHGLLGILKDISEIYKMKEELEIRNKQLHEMVEKAEELSKLKDHFLANITHELRTPLTAILASAEALSRYGVENLSDIQLRQIQAIERNCVALIEQINDILDLSKLREKSTVINLTDITINSLSSTLTEVMSPLFKEKGIDFKITIDKNVSESFVADWDKLKKILLNLLSNALKFTHHGHVELRIKSAKDCLEFSVNDTGIGIKEPHMQRIFEEFYQIDGSDSRRYPGSGLGLTIVEKLTHLMGGRVSAASVEGSGSTFTITIPFRRNR